MMVAILKQNEKKLLLSRSWFIGISIYLLRRKNKQVKKQKKNCRPPSPRHAGRQAADNNNEQVIPAGDGATTGWNISKKWPSITNSLATLVFHRGIPAKKKGCFFLWWPTQPASVAYLRWWHCSKMCACLFALFFSAFLDTFSVTAWHWFLGDGNSYVMWVCGVMQRSTKCLRSFSGRCATMT